MPRSNPVRRRAPSRAEAPPRCPASEIREFFATLQQLGARPAKARATPPAKGRDAR